MTKSEYCASCGQFVGYTPCWEYKDGTDFDYGEFEPDDEYGGETDYGYYCLDCYDDAICEMEDEE